MASSKFGIPKYFEDVRKEFVDMKSGPGGSFEDDCKQIWQFCEKKISESGKWAATLLPLLGNSQAAVISTILEGIFNIATFAACLAAVVLIKRAIDREVSKAINDIKMMLGDVLDHVSKRYVTINQRLEEIDTMVLDIKIKAEKEGVEAIKILIITLKEKIRLCNLDISESIEKIRRINTTITASAQEMNGEAKKSAITSVLFGVGALVGFGVATVATGGLATIIGIGILGGGVSAQLGFGYYCIKCESAKKEFIRMKGHLNQILGNFEEYKKRLDSHVTELKNGGLMQ